ncbi:MAG TPA: ABC transporter permease [Leptospiraceae bacterium]|nr:ABC transporter permease [Leptospiraceae bacterium]
MIEFLEDIHRYREILWDLVQREIKVRYVGSYLGFVWAFIHPAVTVLLLYFVFTLGIKSQPVQDVPFALWLVAGMVPWNFYSEAISSSVYSVLDKSFLVKKIRFRVSILPLIKILASCFVHSVFILLMFFIFWISGQSISFHSLQVFYYFAACTFVILGFSYITSSVVVFFRDFGHLVSMALQFGFWFTPIFWPYKAVPENYRLLLNINPAYYIIEGYRDSFLHKVWFWNKPYDTLIFWVISLIVFVSGVKLFRTLKPHFADVI